MNSFLKALLPTALIFASTVTTAEPIAQLNVAWTFDSASDSKNRWQANALLSQGFNRGTDQQLPIYQYSIDSLGSKTSQLIGAPVANGFNPLNVDGGFSLSTVMIMGGFIAAGLVIADELSDDETPPVAQEDGGE